MERYAKLAGLLTFVAVVACSTGPSLRPDNSEPAAPTASAAATIESGPPIVMAWTSDGFDPNPGGVVVGGIAGALNVPPAAVTAAVFLFSHPRGNGAEIWVFRAQGLTSHEAALRWASFESRCPGPSTSGTLAGLPALLIHRSIVDQCQPEYLVELDATTVVKIIDDGAFHGTANPTVPYRPSSDIEQLVVWLLQNLPGIPLMTGGPNPIN